jgi:hypothetical protein
MPARQEIDEAGGLPGESARSPPEPSAPRELSGDGRPGRWLSCEVNADVSRWHRWSPSDRCGFSGEYQKKFMDATKNLVLT